MDVQLRIFTTKDIWEFAQSCMGTKCELFAKFLSLRVYEPRGSLTNLSRFQGARPDHVRVESSCCCFPSEVISYFCRPTTCDTFSSNGKRIWFGRFNKRYCDRHFSLVHFVFPIQSTYHVMILRRFDPLSCSLKRVYSCLHVLFLMNKTKDQISWISAHVCIGKTQCTSEKVYWTTE